MKGRSESPVPSEMRLSDVPDRLSCDTEPCPPGPELSTCGRCGLPFGDQPNNCGDNRGPLIATVGAFEARLACRDREIGTLKAFHRGSVRKLERVMENLNDLLETLS